MPYKADLVDSFRERWRFNDRPLPSGYSVKVRDQGELLTNPTDYTVEEDSIIQLAGGAGEPLTVEVERDDHLLTDVLSGVLVERGPLAAGDLNLTRLASLLPYTARTVTRRRPVAEVTREVLAGSLAYITQERSGRLRADVLLPPTAPGPRGGPCLEIASAGGAVADVEWAHPAGEQATKDFTLAVWLKSFRSAASVFGTRYVNLMDLLKTSGFANEPAFLWYLNLSPGVPLLTLERFALGGGGMEVAAKQEFGAGDFYSGLGDWWFFAVTYQESLDQTVAYAGRQGGTLRAIGSATGLGMPAVPGSNGVRVGGSAFDPYFRGSVAEPQIWDVPLTFTAVENAFKGTLPNTTGRIFYADLDGLSAASLVDQHSSTPGVVGGDVVARPDLTVDLRKTPRPWNEKRLRPAKRIEVRFDRNEALGPAEIAPAATDAERAEAQAEWGGTELWADPEVADDYLDAKELTFDTPWVHEEAAIAQMRLARYRFGEGRYFAALGRREGSPLRQGLTLETGDEVRVYGHGDMTSGPVYRVASNRVSFNDLDCELGLVR